MPVTKIRGANINYEIVGNKGPWVALITGGRRAYNEFVPLANKIAKGGYRVLLHDRRNTGASDILFDSDEVEEATWADDLAVLLSQLQAAPAFIGGSSAGARTAILFALRHPAAVRALLLLRVTGGAFAAERLPENYYDQYIRAAEQGGMAAVCATEQYAERIAANPGNRERLMSMDAKRYIAVMRRWRELFVAGAHLPVMGVHRCRAQFDQGSDHRHSGQRQDPCVGERPRGPRAHPRAASSTGCRSPNRTCRSSRFPTGRPTRRRSRACSSSSCSARANPIARHRPPCLLTAPGFRVAPSRC